MTRLRRYMSENGMALLLLELMRWLMTRVRSALFRRILKAKGLIIGRNVRILGARFLKVGSDFRCGDDIWIEALQLPGKDAPRPILDIGDRVSISRWVHIACVNRILIGDSCLIGSKVLISDHNHGRYAGHGQSDPSTRPNDRELSSGGPVIIGKNVWIGDNAVILGSVEIGDGAIVAANAVVIKSVPSNTIVAGIPGRVVKRFDPLSSTWVAFADRSDE